MTPGVPVPISADHEVSGFRCGTPSLDDWLQRRALANDVAGASRCYVSCAGDTICGYYALAANSVALAEGSGRFGTNMPDPVPVVVLGRLAVDLAWQGKGFGAALFRDAGRQVLAASEIVGIRGMIVQAISAEARAFYIRLGMSESPLSPMTLVVTCRDLRAAG
jgi:GNAT superfamily N-acetyltransferase